MSAHPTMLAANEVNGAACGQDDFDRTAFSAVRISAAADDVAGQLRAPSNQRVRFNPIAQGLLGLVWLYQKTLSPVLPALFGPTCGCRFYPTCSHYAAEAVRTHGALFGSWLAVRRLLKCTPLHP